MTNDELRERMTFVGAIQAHGAFVDEETITRLLSDSDECVRLRRVLEEIAKTPNGHVWQDVAKTAREALKVKP